MDEEIKNVAEEAEAAPVHDSPETTEETPAKDLGDKMEELRDKAADVIHGLSDKVEDTLDDLKEKFHEKKEAAQPKIDDAKEKMKDAMDTPDTTGEYDASDIKGNKLMAALSYLGILILIPLFAAKESKFARFHLNQGLLVLILSVAVWFFGKVNQGLITWILNLVVFVFAVIGIVNAVSGKAKELPFIGKIRILK